MGLGVDMVVTIFLLRGAFWIELMLDRCACMWHFSVASEIGLYLGTWFTVIQAKIEEKNSNCFALG